MEAGVGHVVSADGGGYGADVADMLDHGGEGEGNDGEHRGPQQRGIDLAGEQAEHGAVPVDGHAYPCGVRHSGGNGLALRRVNYQREDVGAEHAQQYGDDLRHALAPHVEADYYRNGDHGDEPVALAVVYRGGGERQADGDDDGAGDDGREEAHDLLHAEQLEQRREYHVHKPRYQHAEAGVGEKRVIVNCRAVRRGADGADGVISADEGEGAAQERGDLALGQQVEKQRADAGEKQRRGYVKPGQRRNEDCRAEHGEHVLKPQHQHTRRAEGARVIDGAVDGRFFHSIYLSL